VLSLGVLILWQYLFPQPKPTPPRPGAASPAASAEHGAAQKTATAAAPLPSAAPAPEPAAAVSAPMLPPIEGEKEQSVVLENDSLRAEFSNRGAVLRSVSAKLPSGSERVELVTGRTPDAMEPFALTDPDGNPIAADKALFAVTRESSAQGDALLFRYRGAAGDVEKRVTLERDGLLDIAVRVSGGKFALYLGPGVRARNRADLANRFDRRLGV